MINWNQKLYNYGYLVSDDYGAIERIQGLDISMWQHDNIGDFNVYVNINETFYVRTKNNVSMLLIGHAYNPFTMQANENDILDRLLNLSGDEYQNYYDQLTGVFFFARFENNKIALACDCAGMQGAYYSSINGKLYFSSHCQIIADVCGLNEDIYVNRLKHSRTFHYYGLFLPGDLSSYKEIKRVIPNTYAIFENGFHIERFYPRKRYSVVEGDYNCIVKRVGELLHNNMVLISQKWPNAAVSLTGGTDSKTTLACASTIQHQLKYYSYVSLPREKTDADAARCICENLELEHEIINIDSNPDSYPEFKKADKLIERHYAYLGKGNENDVCKRIILAEKLKYDIEVKSWVSEIARASRYNIYGKNKFPNRITSRMLTSMYKVFTYDRWNAIRTDRYFKEYIENTDFKKRIEETKYPWTEFFVWEIVFGGWGGLTISCEHKTSNNITVPYNNRAILDLMLRTPLEKRKNDQLHHDIMDSTDPRINRLGIHVINGNESKKRQLAERIYFDIHSHLPI